MEGDLEKPRHVLTDTGQPVDCLLPHPRRRMQVLRKDERSPHPAVHVERGPPLLPRIARLGTPFALGRLTEKPLVSIIRLCCEAIVEGHALVAVRGTGADVASVRLWVEGWQVTRRIPPEVVLA